MIDVATYVMMDDEVLHELTTQWGPQYGVKWNRKRDMISKLRFYLNAPQANRVVFKLPEGCREVHPLLAEGWTVIDGETSGYGYHPYLCSGWVPE